MQIDIRSLIYMISKDALFLIIALSVLGFFIFACADADNDLFLFGYEDLSDGYINYFDTRRNYNGTFDIGHKDPSPVRSGVCESFFP